MYFQEYLVNLLGDVWGILTGLKQIWSWEENKLWSFWSLMNVSLAWLVFQGSEKLPVYPDNYHRLHVHFIAQYLRHSMVIVWLCSNSLIQTLRELSRSQKLLFKPSPFNLGSFQYIVAFSFSQILCLFVFLLRKPNWTVSTSFHLQTRN